MDGRRTRTQNLFLIGSKPKEETTRRLHNNNHGDWKTENQKRQHHMTIRENAKSVAGGPLPDDPPDLVVAKDDETDAKMGTILLFYQYKEPSWTPHEHKYVLKDFISIAQRFGITGRGRVAPEGMNCTLTGRPDSVRQFCQHLRQEYDPQLFQKTDFKLTDGIPPDKLFKSLSIRKTDELVAFGMSGEDKAPRLDKFAGVHLTADQYHEAMQQDNTVIVDVRNAYETTLGRFQPPAGGAQLLDPKLRHSNEFPNWLADPKTQEKLHGKTVLMYCTGGIRCERATALVNQMASASSPGTFQPQGVYELEGGIERYLKRFPRGGLWKGKNYLFDRRMEQVPSDKPAELVERECASMMESSSTSAQPRCVLCHVIFTRYRGQFQCGNRVRNSRSGDSNRKQQASCSVPVIVCPSCVPYATEYPDDLRCPLCVEGYEAPKSRPNLVHMKQRAEEEEIDQGDAVQRGSKTKKRKRESTEDGSAGHKEEQVKGKVVIEVREDSIFVSRLPLTVTKTKLEALFGTISILHWLTDRRTGAFYGSCIIQLVSSLDAKRAVQPPQDGVGQDANPKRRLVVDKKKIKVAYYRPMQCKRGPKQQYDGGDAVDERSSGNKQQDSPRLSWPPAKPRDGEYPPIGHHNR